MKKHNKKAGEIDAAIVTMTDGNGSSIGYATTKYNQSIATAKLAQLKRLEEKFDKMAEKGKAIKQITKEPNGYRISYHNLTLK
jgi:hypothetical protein